MDSKDCMTMATTTATEPQSSFAKKIASTVSSLGVQRTEKSFVCMRVWPVAESGHFKLAIKRLKNQSSHIDANRTDNQRQKAQCSLQHSVCLCCFCLSSFVLRSVCCLCSPSLILIPLSLCVCLGLFLSSSRRWLATASTE